MFVGLELHSNFHFIMLWARSERVIWSCCMYYDFIGNLYFEMLDSQWGLMALAKPPNKNIAKITTLPLFQVFQVFLFSFEFWLCHVPIANPIPSHPIHLYVSRKFPCTTSPNSRLSASSWKRGAFLQNRILCLQFATILPCFGPVCLWLACLKKCAHGHVRQPFGSVEYPMEWILSTNNWKYCDLFTQKKNQFSPWKNRPAPSWSHNLPGSL